MRKNESNGKERLLSSSSNNSTNENSESLSSKDFILNLENSDLHKNDNDEPDSVYKSTVRPLNSGEHTPTEKRKNSFNLYKKFKGDMTSHQAITLVTVLLGTLTSSLAICLFPPFFPRLAEEKNVTPSIYMLIIGINCLVAFTVTPIIGNQIMVIGVKFAFVTGIFTSGICCILSGFLEFFPPGLPFILTSFAIRIIHATGNAGVITSTITYIALEFPDDVGKYFAMSRATMNLAQMFGPALGGLLFQLDSFKLPFIVIGSAQVITSFVCFFTLPAFEGGDSKKSEAKAWGMLLVPRMWVSFITFVFSTASNGFLSVTLEPFIIRELNLKPVYVGLLFGLKDGVNSIASILWGYTSDRHTHLKLFITIGSIMACTSFVLLGPFPGLPLHHTLLLVIFALSLNGIGISGQQVAGVIHAMREAIAAGYPNDPTTNGFVAGLWSSLSGGGRFASRASSGFFIDCIGFRATSTIFVAFHIFIIVVTQLSYLFCKSKSDEHDEDDTKVYRDKTKANAFSPSEPVSVKIPTVREDLEDSFAFGSAPTSKSVESRRYKPRSESIVEESP